VKVKKLNRKRKTEIIREVWESMGRTATIDTITKIVDALSDVILTEISFGREVGIPRIGMLTPVVRARKVGQDLIAGRTVEIPSRVGIKLRLSASAKRRLPDRLSS